MTVNVVIFTTSPGAMLFMLLVGHALADYPLQGDFLAQAKNPTTPVGKVFWPWALTSHALINGGAVYLVTGSLFLGICEAVAHWVIDLAKCEGKIGIHTDQALHVGCKVLWWITVVAAVRP